MLPDTLSTAGVAGAKRGGQQIGRVDVSEPASLSTGIAKRYATAVFELAQEAKALDALEADIDQIDTALADSAELRAMIASPLYRREEQARAIRAIAEKMGLGGILTNTLSLMASKRRLFVVPQLVAVLRARLSEARGEITADVVSAKPLNDEQVEKLKATLKQSIGSDVNIKASVDESLIGGLVIKVGSKMIDTSIRSKLAGLQNTMKEVG